MKDRFRLLQKPLQSIFCVTLFSIIGLSAAQKPPLSPGPFESDTAVQSSPDLFAGETNSVFFESCAHNQKQIRHDRINTKWFSAPPRKFRLTLFDNNQNYSGEIIRAISPTGAYIHYPYNATGWTGTNGAPSVAVGEAFWSYILNQSGHGPKTWRQQFLLWP